MSLSSSIKFKKITFLLLVLILAGCKPIYTFNFTGPQQVCPNDAQLGYYKKSNRPYQSFKSCFNASTEDLIKQNKLFSYVKWLEIQKDYKKAEQVLLDGTLFDQDNNQYYLELAKLSFIQKRWHEAENYINLAGVESDHPLIPRILARTGHNSSESSVLNAPYVFSSPRKNTFKSAKVLVDNSTKFSLKRIDDASPGILAGETSITASADGKNILAVWTDNSGVYDDSSDRNYWRLRSARSTDYGQTWKNDPFSIMPENDDIYHFDPITAYDPITETIYAGGHTVNYFNSAENSIYIKNWDLQNNEIQAANVHNWGFIDKGWLAVDPSGVLVLIEGLTGQRYWASNNKAASFFESNTGVSFTSPYPSYDKTGCLHIIDYTNYIKCDNEGGFINIDVPYSSLSLEVMGSYLPGTFRAIPLTFIGFGPDNTAYIVYPDLKSPDSNDIALWMTKSSDHVTWEEPFIITPNVTGDRFFPWMKVDDGGRIHLSYADTRSSEYNDGDLDVSFDMYYSYSDDGGSTWFETRITPYPLEISPNMLTWGTDFIGDYLELSVPNEKDVYLALPWYTESGDIDLYVAKKEENTSSDFNINQGVNGAWFFPETSGSGLFFDFRPGDNFLFAAWFTHVFSGTNTPTEDNGTRWYTASGISEGNIAHLDLYETRNGLFDDPQNVTTSPVGSLSITFNGCNSATVEYELFSSVNRSGQFPIVRAVPGTEELCSFLQPE